MSRKAFAVALAVACAGCAGGHGWVSAPTSRYPISLTHGIRAADGHLLTNKERKIVGHFDTSKTFVSLLYDAIPLNGSFDVSDDVNEQVRAAGGEAVTDLTFQTHLCALDFFLGFHMLPIWPGCATVHVTGNIIRSVQYSSEALR
jgi:hypothetical protein